jgi:hypothetical protein
MPKFKKEGLIMYETITITMKDDYYAAWEKDEWDDYNYDGKFFIVMKNKTWVGFYNLDCVKSIIVE